MSLQQDCWQEEIPVDTAQLARELLEEDDVYRIIGERVNSVLSLEEFAPMYSNIGRGAVCPIILMLVVIFQYLENLPDREAARWAARRIDWKYALHVPLLWEGFHYSTLCNFRKRLVEREAERMLFEKVLQFVRQHGLLKRHGKQRSDSTHVIGQVAELSRLEMLWETLRLALRAVKRQAATWYATQVPATIDEKYGERQSDWRLSFAEKREQTKQVGQDGYWFLDRLTEEADESLLELAEVKTLQKVWEQQFIRTKDDDGGQKMRLRPKKRGQQKDTIETPHDTDARWTQKRGKGWTGYKLQVTETVEAEYGQRFITDIDVYEANQHDSEHVDEIQQRLQERGLAPKVQYVDSGYISARNIINSRERGIDLFGPSQHNQSRKPDGFRQSDFNIDFEQQRATCPAGQTSDNWYWRDGSDKQGYVVQFGNLCNGCPLRKQCAPGKSGRSLFINAYYHELQERRRLQQTVQFKEAMKQRSAVEGRISALVRKHGARRARYRGLPRVRLQYFAIGAAANLKQLARALRNRRRPQTVQLLPT